MKYIYSIILFIFLPIQILACTCLHPTIKESFENADQIFVGNAEIVDSTEVSNNYVYLISITPTIRFKGRDKSEFVYIPGSDSCSISRSFFHRDQKYIFYFAERMESIQLSNCSRTVSEFVHPTYSSMISKTKFQEDLEKLYELNPNPTIIKNRNWTYSISSLIIILIAFIIYFSMKIKRKRK